MDNKTCVQEITSHRKKFDEAIFDVAFHPSKPYIASAGADALAKVFVWNYSFFFTMTFKFLVVIYHKKKFPASISAHRPINYNLYFYLFIYVDQKGSCIVCWQNIDPTRDSPLISETTYI